jgi:hypothetical protein
LLTQTTRPTLHAAGRAEADVGTATMEAPIRAVAAAPTARARNRVRAIADSLKI